MVVKSVHYFLVIPHFIKIHVSYFLKKWSIVKTNWLRNVGFSKSFFVLHSCQCGTMSVQWDRTGPGLQNSWRTGQPTPGVLQQRIPLQIINCYQWNPGCSRKTFLLQSFNLKKNILRVNIYFKNHDFHFLLKWGLQLLFVLLKVRVRKWTAYRNYLTKI